MALGSGVVESRSHHRSSKEYVFELKKKEGEIGMRYMSGLDEYPIEKRVSVFKRNDRESPKGIKPLPSNQNSYIVRDRYPFTDGTTGYFTNVLTAIYRALSEEKVNITEVRAMNYALNWFDWPEYLWNKLMVALKLKKLILYSRYCYSRGAIKGIKKNHLEDEVFYTIKSLFCKHFILNF